MTDLTAPATEPLPSQAQASHDSRLGFQNFAYFTCGGIVIAVVLVLMVGVVYPPPMPCLPGAIGCLTLPDYGAVIVSRLESASGLLFELLGALGGLAGITLARGHMDLRVPLQKDGGQ